MVVPSPRLERAGALSESTGRDARQVRLLRSSPYPPAASSCYPGSQPCRLRRNIQPQRSRQRGKSHLRGIALSGRAQYTYTASSAPEPVLLRATFQARHRGG